MDGARKIKWPLALILQIQILRKIAKEHLDADGKILDGVTQKQEDSQQQLLQLAVVLELQWALIAIDMIQIKHYAQTGLL